MSVKKVIIKIEREFDLSDDPYNDFFGEYDEETGTYTQTASTEKIVAEALRFFHEDLTQEYSYLEVGESYPSAEVEIIEA